MSEDGSFHNQDVEHAPEMEDDSDVASDSGITNLTESLHVAPAQAPSAKWTINLAPQLQTSMRDAMQQEDFCFEEAGLPVLVRMRVGNEGNVLRFPTLGLYSATGEMFRGLLMTFCEEQRKQEATPNTPKKRPLPSVEDDQSSVDNRDLDRQGSVGQGRQLTLPPEHFRGRALTAIHALITSHEAVVDDNLEVATELLAAARWLGFSALQEAVMTHLTNLASSKSQAVNVYMFVHSHRDMETVEKAAKKYICSFWRKLIPSQRALIRQRLSGESLRDLVTALRNALEVDRDVRGEKMSRNIFAALADIVNNPALSDPSFKEFVVTIFPFDGIYLDEHNVVSVFIHTLTLHLPTADDAAMLLLESWDDLPSSKRDRIVKCFRHEHWSTIAGVICNGVDINGDQVEVKHPELLVGDLLRWSYGRTNPRDVQVIEEVMQAIDLKSFKSEQVLYVVEVGCTVVGFEANGAHHIVFTKFMPMIHARLKAAIKNHVPVLRRQ